MDKLEDKLGGQVGGQVGGQAQDGGGFVAAERHLTHSQVLTWSDANSRPDPKPHNMGARAQMPYKLPGTFRQASGKLPGILLVICLDI